MEKSLIFIQKDHFSPSPWPYRIGSKGSLVQLRLSELANYILLFSEPRLAKVCWSLMSLDRVQIISLYSHYHNEPTLNIRCEGLPLSFRIHIQTQVWHWWKVFDEKRHWLFIHYIQSMRSNSSILKKCCCDLMMVNHWWCAIFKSV